MRVGSGRQFRVHDGSGRVQQRVTRGQLWSKPFNWAIGQLSKRLVIVIEARGAHVDFFWINHRFRYFHCLFEWKWVKFMRCCQIQHNFTCIDYLCRLDKTFNFTDKFQFDTFFKTKFETSWHITRLSTACFAKLSAFKNSAGFLAHPAVYTKRSMLYWTKICLLLWTVALSCMHVAYWYVNIDACRQQVIPPCFRSRTKKLQRRSCLPSVITAS